MNLNNTLPIFDIPISRMGRPEAVRCCLERIQKRDGGYACFINVHTVTESVHLPQVRSALQGATFGFADGLPLVWVSRLKRQPVASRVCGPDFMKDLLESSPHQIHGFIGGSPGQAADIAARFGVSAHSHSPPMRPFSVQNAQEDWAEFLRGCPEGKAPGVVWVGLGAPKQEFWMHAISGIAPETMFFGVGAAFDFLSQTKKRAPLWMQKLGLEWFFRLTQEPGRLWKRYLSTNFEFLRLVLFDLVGVRRK